MIIMNNYGTKVGKGSNFGDSATITTTTNIDKRKNHMVISITICVVIIVAIIVFLMFRPSGTNIVGRWTTNDGETIEFLSDGTLHQGGNYDSLNADIYEIMDEGYLKWGKYDAGWIEYRYTYWNVELNGNNLTLIMRDNPDRIIELIRE